MFLRSKGPTDSVNCLWLMDASSGAEYLLADPDELLGDGGRSDPTGGMDLPAAERDRRERARESAGGIVSYSTDRSGCVAAFVFNGALFVVDASATLGTFGGTDPRGAPDETEIRRIDTGADASQAFELGVFDPQMSPDARYVSFVLGDSLWVAPATGTAPGWPLLVTDEPTVSWGRAEFIAAEEMRRSRGHWWSPHSDAIAATYVNVAEVAKWHISDPTNPYQSPRTVRYPAAGTANAEVELHIVKVADAPATTQMRWDATALPYLVDVGWKADFGLTIVVQSRDQRELQTLSGNPTTGDTQVVSNQTDANWVDIVSGAPVHCPLGLLTVGEHYDTRAIALDGVPVTSPEEWVREIVDVRWRYERAPVEVLYLASEVPSDVVLYSIVLHQDHSAAPRASGESRTPSERCAANEPRRTLSRAQGVVVSAVARSGTTVIAEASLRDTTRFTVNVCAESCAASESTGLSGTELSGTELSGIGLSSSGLSGTELIGTGHPVSSKGIDPFDALAQGTPPQPLDVELCTAGPLEVPIAILWPQHQSAVSQSAALDQPAITSQPAALNQPALTDMPSTRLPILLDPYGGPGVQRVLSARSAYASSQWLANQGYCVVIADGRGTPGRSRSWEIAIRGDLAQAALDDQIAALDHITANFGERVDPNAVAIRGWSFGGYLAALAVLRRPDRFHAAIAGAPVTDWSLYDTHYTERYLGTPDQEPDNYRRSSLLKDRPAVKRPIMLIHGLADDNVVAAHTLRLSAALLAAGHPHEVLPLIGVTHMASQEVVAENLLLAQLNFLRRRLALGVQ